MSLLTGWRLASLGCGNMLSRALSSSAAGRAFSAAAAAAEAPSSDAGSDAPAQQTNTPLPTLAQVPADLLPSFMESGSKKKAPVDLATALKTIKENARAKFPESVDVSLKLSIDPKRGDQIVRSVAQLPHGTGKAAKVAVFATGEAAERALAAGADVVGDESLIEEIRTSKSIPFDKCIAMQDMVPKLSKIARILGPRGLMPNPKLGTIVNDSTLLGKLEDMKKGQVAFRNERQGFVYAGIGRTSFTEEQLQENFASLLSAVMAAKPKAIKAVGAKGYIERVSISSTMGAGVRVNMESVTSLVG